MKRMKVKAKLQKYRIVAYDLECTTDGPEHVPNFISARFTCTICEDRVQDCEICGKKEEPRHLTWCSKDCEPLSEFIKWLLSFKNFDTVAYAHFACEFSKNK